MLYMLLRFQDGGLESGVGPGNEVGCRLPSRRDQIGVTVTAGEWISISCYEFIVTVYFVSNVCLVVAAFILDVQIIFYHQYCSCGLLISGLILYDHTAVVSN